MTMDQINSKLAELREEKTKIQGLETEVYARIVGYYRSVRNWNKGKKEEYGKRVNYCGTESNRPTVADAVSAAPAPAANANLAVVEDESQQQLTFSAAASPVPASYLYFYRKTCPNCRPVAGWLEGSGLEGRAVDVDRESGMHEAMLHDVTAAPTVVILDDGGREMGRGSTVAALEAQVGIAAAAGA